MRPLFLILLNSILLGSYAQVSTVELLPNPKEEYNGFVSNPDRVLNDSTVSYLNSILSTLESRNTTQVAVVALRSIGDFDLFHFSQQLFDKWKIGQSKNDNGLLILLVVDDRKMRFHTGEGIEDVLPDITTNHIQKHLMIPYFKAGNFNGGIIAGVREAVKILGNAQYADHRNEVIRHDERKKIIGLTVFVLVLLLMIFAWKRSNGDFSGKSSIRHERRLPYVRNTEKSWALWFLLSPLIAGAIAIHKIDAILFLISLYVIVALSLIASWQRLNKELFKWELKNEYRTIYDFLISEKWLWTFSTALFPVPGALFLFFYNKKFKYFRDHPRNCKDCSSMMQKIDKQSEKDFLKASQVFEEKIKAVDYDVWKCADCAKIHLEVYDSHESKLTYCSKCRTKALHLEKSMTTLEPTGSTTGTKEEHYRCKFCNHQDVKLTTLPITTFL